LLRGLDGSGGGLVGVWRVSGRLPGCGEFFTSRYGGWVVALRSGFLGYACAGVPGEAFPAFAGWLLSWCWLWVGLCSFSGSLVGIEKVFLIKLKLVIEQECKIELLVERKGK